MIDIAHALTRIDYREELVDRTEDQLRGFLTGLNAVCGTDTPNLNELRDWVQSQLENELKVPTREDREVVERRKTSDGCYQLEMIRCGKKTCKCAKGDLHGPYWYCYQKKGGRVVSKYIGKKKPVELDSTENS